MGFKHDFTGVKEFGAGFDPIPEGDYEFVITKTKDKKTAAGDNMVNVTCKVLAGAQAGRLVFHNVTFLPKDHKAAGMAKHFLKVIAQPHEDEVDVDSEMWKDETFKAHVVIKEYKGKLGNEIDEVYDREETAPIGEEVPF